MKLQNHKRIEWNPADLPLTELLQKVDRVYADKELTARRFFDAGDVRRIHISKRADLLVTEAGGRPLCIKYFHDRRLRVELRTFLGLAKGRRGFRNGLRLAASGVRVPHQLACLEFRPFGPTVVVMELLDSICTVVSWLIERQESGGVSREAIQQFSEFVAAMHRQGVFHCDFSPRNVMVQRAGGDLEFVLIDLEDVRFGRSADRRRCIKTLARFARESLELVSIRTTIRFLRLYAREMSWNLSAAFLAREIRTSIKPRHP